VRLIPAERRRAIDWWGRHPEIVLPDALRVVLAAWHERVATPFGVELVADLQDRVGATVDGMWGDESQACYDAHTSPGPSYPSGWLPGQHYSPREVEPFACVLHWTASATTVQQCATALHKRGLSTHWACDAWQSVDYLDPERWRAWHARGCNHGTIGGDICQPVMPKREDEARAAGYETHVTTNPTPRGERRVLALDPVVRDMAASKLVALHDHFGWEPKWHDTHDQVAGGWDEMRALGFTVVGHHHVAEPNRRWDVAPWFDEIVKAAFRSV